MSPRQLPTYDAKQAVVVSAQAGISSAVRVRAIVLLACRDTRHAL